MGDLNVRSLRTRQEQQEFVRYLLKDAAALERMLREEWFETDPLRIGAEQEMCLVDRFWKPIHINLEALDVIGDASFTSELANFNLEANLAPLPFAGDSLSRMHQNLKSTLDHAQNKVNDLGANLLLCGILPTIRKADVEIANITPLDRYRALMDGLKELRGEAFELRITGIDELGMKQDTAMLEACNTSFQVHLQVTPDQFVQRYNYAQAVAGPVLAAAVNSPMLFGRRLWQETRIALFQQSIDIRTLTEHFRDRSPRVTFGNDWLRHSIMEIYREDVARFKVLLITDVDEDVFEKMDAGITPKLRALNIHNSTVYRWNRPCYGISPNGQPHLRIENRVFPAGPSLPDAVANAAFWLGLMNGMDDTYPDISEVMDFSDAKSNFFAAARFGMDTQFTWANDTRVSPSELILNELLPIARHGLEKRNIVKADIDKYLGIIQERVESSHTGSRWILQSFNKLAREGLQRDEIITSITSSMYTHQHEGTPVHKWDLANADNMNYEPTTLLVEEFMQTDLITVQEDDIVDFAATVMDWRRIRHVAVEDKSGTLVGLITMRMLLRFMAATMQKSDSSGTMTIKEVMRKNPVTVSPEESIIKAMELMKAHAVGCLPVLKNEKLVGMITEGEFMTITGNLVRRLAKKGQVGVLRE